MSMRRSPLAKPLLAALLLTAPALAASPAFSPVLVQLPGEGRAELLHTYGSGRRTPEADRLFLEQLDLIGRRMQEVVHERHAQHVRVLTAQRRYLESKYREDDE